MSDVLERINHIKRLALNAHQGEVIKVLSQIARTCIDLEKHLAPLVSHVFCAVVTTFTDVAFVRFNKQIRELTGLHVGGPRYWSGLPLVSVIHDFFVKVIIKFPNAAAKIHGMRLALFEAANLNQIIRRQGDLALFVQPIVVHTHNFLHAETVATCDYPWAMSSHRAPRRAGQ